MDTLKKIFAIQGFTSSGKDSITSRVSKELNIPILVSHTTRPPRTGEINGVSYHFVDDDFFNERHRLRGDCPKEFERRFQDDKKRFKGYLSDYVVYNKDLEKAIEKAKFIIIDEMSELEI